MDGEIKPAVVATDYSTEVQEEPVERDIRQVVDYAVMHPFALHFNTDRVHLPKTLKDNMQRQLPDSYSDIVGKLCDHLLDNAEPIVGSAHLTANLRVEVNVGSSPVVDRLTPDAPAAYEMIGAGDGMSRHRAVLAKDIAGIDPELHDVPAGLVFLLQPADPPPTDRSTQENKPGGNLYKLEEVAMDAMAVLDAALAPKLQPELRPHSARSPDEIRKEENLKTPAPEKKEEEPEAEEETEEAGAGIEAETGGAEDILEDRKKDEETLLKTGEESAHRLLEQRETAMKLWETEHRRLEQLHGRLHHLRERREQQKLLQERAADAGEVAGTAAEAAARVGEAQTESARQFIELLAKAIELAGAQAERAAQLTEAQTESPEEPADIYAQGAEQFVETLAQAVELASQLAEAQAEGAEELAKTYAEGATQLAEILAHASEEVAGAQGPEAAAQEIELPEAEAPGTETSDSEAPQPEALETGAPEAEAPAAEEPEAETAETEAPEAEAPAAEEPGAETTETEAPEAEVPAAEEPETEEQEASPGEAPTGEETPRRPAEATTTEEEPSSDQPQEHHPIGGQIVEHIKDEMKEEVMHAGEMQGGLFHKRTGHIHEEPAHTEPIHAAHTRTMQLHEVAARLPSARPAITRAREIEREVVHRAGKRARDLGNGMSPPSKTRRMGRRRPDAVGVTRGARTSKAPPTQQEIRDSVQTGATRRQRTTPKITAKKQTRLLAKTKPFAFLGKTSKPRASKAPTPRMTRNAPKPVSVRRQRRKSKPESGSKKAMQKPIRPGPAPDQEPGPD
jgi:hypothetical protein